MGRYSLPGFLRDQFTTLPPIETLSKDLTGKTVIVTGANVGLGLEAARHLASMNPGRLILACRSAKSAEEAVKDIQTTTGCKTVVFWPLDLSSFKSVTDFVDRFEKEGGGRLDILVQNAGIARREYVQTEDGYESTIQTNHLSSALLTILLLPILSKTESRVVVVSSELHLFVKNLEEAKSPQIIAKLSDKAHCTPSVMRQRYNVSKALNVFFVKALAARLPSDTLITVDAVTPGFCHSKLTRESKGAVGVLVAILKALIARTTEAGSRNLVYAALSGTQAEMQGKYLNKCQVYEESDYILSAEGQKVQDRLWDETVSILSEKDGRVKSITAELLRAV
ncbi:NAD(P)-binding protein [Sistotremastrum suecicum HHB10207 ss-3]|uniref:NAD(P)-binding protein n=1 Tax=Sistotremastrum suecicum HHB10207 ss-3 TaxID=1314776 RepID=A0A166E4I5_9AGAM|nr:NAD(P)-binding protein [Sistotremastrum suecicum HHB10207 ss-3]